MNISIVTVYNSENCGSFLQAFALSKYIKQKGHNVNFLKRPVMGTSHSKFSICIEMGKCALRLNYNQVKLIALRHRNFNVALDIFSEEDESKTQKNTDCYVLGSDTIWDFNNEYFRKKSDLFTGKILKNNHFVIYAASCSNTNPDNIKKYSIDMSSLNNAVGISVRDKATHDLLKVSTGIHAEIVVDPTLLIDKNYYKQFVKENIPYKYLLIYCFGKLQKKQQEAIIEFANENDLKIISLGNYEKLYYKSVPASPQAFITYYKSASYVITNTFHGTIFATIFQKQFVVVTSDKNKICDYLNSINLEDRIEEDPSKMANAILKPIDYEDVNKHLNVLKKNSIDFIDKYII